MGVFVIESILTSVKKMLGVAEHDDHFDSEIIIHINSVLATLTQLGVGPSKGFVVKDQLARWVDFVGDTEKMEHVKSYLYLKVRLLFDPPTNSFTIEAIERLAKEFEWRLHAEAEGGE